MKIKEQKKQFLNNVYDLIKICGLSNKQNDNWAKLSRIHAKKATKEMKKLLYNKEIEVDLDTNIISIGKKIKLKLL